jgi:ankyrin repeat protein
MKLKHILGIALVTASLLSLTTMAAAPDVANAAMKGNRAAVKTLIDQKVDVNIAQPDGSTALHWAAYRQDIELANMLLKAGANPKTPTRDGATPLSLASTNGDAPLITALIKAGADPNEKLPTGKTNLMLASRNGNVDGIRALIDAGADVNAKEDLRGTTALMWAADEAHAPALKLLIERDADVKARSKTAARGRGAALGKSGDPRRQVAQQAAAVAAGQPSADLGTFNLGGDAVAATGGNNRNNNRGGNNRGGNNANAANAAAAADQPVDDAASVQQPRNAVADGGELTALIYVARNGDIASAKVLLDAGADVNQTSGYGWSPLLAATQNRNYKMGVYLLSRGADVNLTNKGGWTPLYLATDNRNIEGGDYPVRKPDMDHLDYIKVLIDKGANINARVKDSTDTRTVFTNQWLDENGATAFLRASQSGDIPLMKLLLEKGADPKINTVLNVSPLQVAAGIGWVEGVTFEWSPAATLEAVKMLLDLGVDPNIQADTGRVAMHGAAHKGRADVIQVLFDHGAKLDVKDYGNTDNRGGALAAKTWEPVDYADGLVRVGVQSAIAHDEARMLLRKLLAAKGLPVPDVNRTLESICITDACGEN